MEEKRCHRCGKQLGENSYFKRENGKDVSYICLDCFNDAYEKNNGKRLTEEDLLIKIKNDSEKEEKRLKNLDAHRKQYENISSFVGNHFPETYEKVKDNMEDLLNYAPEDGAWISFLCELLVIMSKASNMDKIQEVNTINKIPFWCGKFTSTLVSIVARLDFFERITGDFNDGLKQLIDSLEEKYITK